MFPLMNETSQVPVSIQQQRQLLHHRRQCFILGCAEALLGYTLDITLTLAVGRRWISSIFNMLAYNHVNFSHEASISLFMTMQERSGGDHGYMIRDFDTLPHPEA